MIKIEPKPHKTISYFNGSIQLDREYKFVVKKQSNGSVTHSVEAIEPDVTESAARQLIEGAILGYCQREGIGQVNVKND